MAFTPSFLILLFLLLPLFSHTTNARPWANGNAMLGRAAFSGPTSFQTVTQAVDAAGNPTTITCTITLTPTVVNGQDEVVMVKSCVTTPGAPSPNTTPPIISQGGAPSTSSSSAGDSPTSAPTATTTSAAPPSGTDAPFKILGTDSIPTESAHHPTATAPSPAITKATLSGTATPTTGATASLAASSQSPSAQFSLPGKTLSVLPIGLGVFAGISVIALLVVGYVTWERTKYRKNFRARKLAEQGGGGLTPYKV